jgi:ketosteroid isomerase-like protein
MSQENVEIVRAATEAWNAGNMAALRDLYDPHIIVRPFDAWPEQGPWIGPEAVIRQWEGQREALGAQTLESIGDYVHVGDRVVVRWRWQGIGRGPELNLELTAVVTIRSGRMTALDFFRDHTEALEAVGLSEQDAHADS